VLSDGWIEIARYLFRMFWRMSLYCSGECFALGEKDFAKTASNLLAGRMQTTRNRAGTYIEHLVEVSPITCGSLPRRVPAASSDACA
jgi:hypothetical protein